MSMTPDQIHNLKKVNQIPGFPYDDFEQLQQASNNHEVKVGAAMDLARKWTMEGASSPKTTRVLLYILALTWFVLPAGAFIAAFVAGKLSLILYAILTFIFFAVLRPMTVRVAPFFKLIIYAGYILVLLGAFNVLGEWALLLGLSIAVPWHINKFIYSHATNVAISEGMKSETRFVELFKYNVLALNYPNGDMIWGYHLIKSKDE